MYLYDDGSALFAINGNSIQFIDKNANQNQALNVAVKKSMTVK